MEVQGNEAGNIYGHRIPVSYTHLDVYKRQGCRSIIFSHTDDGYPSPLFDYAGGVDFCLHWHFKHTVGAVITQKGEMERIGTYSCGAGFGRKFGEFICSCGE